MPLSPRTKTQISKPHCPNHPTATVLTCRHLGDDRLCWTCMDCGKKLGDAGPVDYSRDKFALE